MVTAIIISNSEKGKNKKFKNKLWTLNDTILNEEIVINKVIKICDDIKN